jgi:hypothetical protein
MVFSLRKRIPANILAFLGKTKPPEEERGKEGSWASQVLLGKRKKEGRED